MKVLMTVTYFSLLWSICEASEGTSMEFNGTPARNFPPLYALDDYELCQNPKDVYCIVDAVLVSTKFSSLLQQIQEYSSKQLKHFNRTLIHRGVCVSRCGGSDPDSWRYAAEKCINSSLVDYGLAVDIQDVTWCKNNKPTPVSTSAKMFVIVCAALLAITFIATGLDALEERFGKCYGIGTFFRDENDLLYRNKYLFSFSLKRNWQTLIFDDKTQKSDECTNDLNCIDGIRFIGTLMVVFQHVSLIYIIAYIENPDFVENLHQNIGTKTMFNTPLWIQSFISISGFLLAYYLLIYTERQSLTLKECFISVLYRYIRLTPVSVFTLWFTISWLPRLGTGPQWSWLVDQEAQYCTELWWYHALYVHNYLTLGKLCMVHTWYLAVDMQLHVIGIFLLVILLRWRNVVIPMLAMIIIASAAITGILVYSLNLSPIISAQSPEIIRNMLKGATTIRLIYLPVWAHIAGYALGISTAFIYYWDKNNGYKLKDNKYFLVIFHSSLVLAGAVCVAGVPFLSDAPPSRWFTAMYASVDKTLVALFFNLFLLGCLSRCKSLLRDILSWRGWYPFGRLSYSVFLIHLVIMRFTIASNLRIVRITAYSSVYLLIVGTVLGYLISVPVYLLIELPFIQIWKAIMGIEGCKKDAQTQEMLNENDLIGKSSAKKLR